MRDSRPLSRRELLSSAALGALAAMPAKRKRKIHLIAGTQSHPPMMHEYNSGVMLLTKCLSSVPAVEASYSLSGWPKVPAALEGVDAVFLYMDGGAGHKALQDDHLQTLAALMKRGVGLGCAHYAVEMPKERGGPEWMDWIGGYYETNWSCNPIWTPNFDRLPKHPITRGVKPFSIQDEWYINMRFRPDMKGITPILFDKPSDAVRHGPYVAPRGPYEHIIANSGRDETMMWAAEREDGGRGFGFTGAHFHKNWMNDDFRKVVLNAIVWIAKADVPKSGVESSISEGDLMTGLYEQKQL